MSQSEDEAALRRLRDLLTRLAANQVDEAITEAIGKVRERTVALVRRELATELLGRLGAPSGPQPAASDSPGLALPAIQDVSSAPTSSARHAGRSG